MHYLRLPSLPLQGAESLKDKATEGSHNTGRLHPASSFVDSVMVALTAEEEVKEDRNISPAELTGDSYCTGCFLVIRIKLSGYLLVPCPSE